MTAADDELRRVAVALALLQRENVLWQTNYNKFIKLPPESKLWWWAAFKRQAEAGAPAPRILLLKVLELRLTS